VLAFIHDDEKEKEIMIVPVTKKNAARGNVLDGGYLINWTGSLYL